MTATLFGLDSNLFGLRIIENVNMPATLETGNVIGSWVYSGPLWFARVLAFFHISPWVSLPMKEVETLIYRTPYGFICHPQVAQQLRAAIRAQP